jgi:hypothetical protein
MRSPPQEHLTTSSPLKPQRNFLSEDCGVLSAVLGCNMSTPAKTFKIGGDLEVNRLGFGAMRHWQGYLG